MVSIKSVNVIIIFALSVLLMFPSVAFAEDIVVGDSNLLNNPEDDELIVQNPSLDETSANNTNDESKRNAELEEAAYLSTEEERKLVDEFGRRIFQDRIDAKKNSVLSYITNNKAKYTNELDSSKRKKINKLRTSVKNSTSIERISSLKKSASNIFKKANTLLLKKNKFYNKTNKSYVKYKTYMQSNQTSKMDNILNKIRKAKSASTFKKLKSAIDLIIYQAKTSIHINANGWSKSHLDYVNKWGKRNNKFLSGTAMSGTGYLIAQAAYENNLDPRICAAIASVESGCGAQPYGCQYNVWGWICNNPAMYSWEDAINKWSSYFRSYFESERYPIQSMYGYCGYSPWYVNNIMAKI